MTLVRTSSSLRVRSLSETLEIARRIAPAVGITRVTDTTALDRLGVPVFASIRPNATRGSLCVSAGKGMTPDEAEAGAYMEAIELAWAEPKRSILPNRIVRAGELGDGEPRPEIWLDFTVGRGVTAANGGDASQFPGGIGDLIGSTAVMLTNAVAGPDDSNWIAPGNTPTGTRGGEIGAGSGALAAALSVAGGNYNPYSIYQAYQQGSQVGQAISPHLGANNAGPTSGARGPNGQANGWAQSVGDEIHQAPGRAMRAMDRGIRDLYGNPGGF